MNYYELCKNMSVFIPGVLQMKKRLKTIRNWEHDVIRNSIFMKLIFNYNMRCSRCFVSPLKCGYFNRKRCRWATGNLGSKKKANASTFLADKNQWMVLVYKVLDPMSEHRVWAYTASTFTAPIDLFCVASLLFQNSAASYFEFAQFAHVTLLPVAIGCKRFKNYALFGRVTSDSGIPFHSSNWQATYFILNTAHTTLF